MREEYREANKGLGFVFLWIVISLVAAGLIGWAIWGFNVATSGVRGEGDGEIQKNSSDNWVAAQADFEENYADYEATLVKIEFAADALESNPDDRISQTNYQGLVNYCASLVADYNADARNFLKEDFKAADLPDHIAPESCVPVALPTELP